MIHTLLFALACAETLTPTGLKTASENRIAELKKDFTEFNTGIAEAEPKTASSLLESHEDEGVEDAVSWSAKIKALSKQMKAENDELENAPPIPMSLLQTQEDTPGSWLAAEGFPTRGDASKAYADLDKAQSVYQEMNKKWQDQDAKMKTNMDKMITDSKKKLAEMQAEDAKKAAAKASSFLETDDFSGAATLTSDFKAAEDKLQALQKKLHGHALQLKGTESSLLEIGHPEHDYVAEFHDKIENKLDDVKDIAAKFNKEAAQEKKFILDETAEYADPSSFIQTAKFHNKGEGIITQEERFRKIAEKIHATAKTFKQATELADHSDDTPEKQAADSSFLDTFAKFEDGHDVDTARALLKGLNRKMMADVEQYKRDSGSLAELKANPESLLEFPHRHHFKKFVGGLSKEEKDALELSSNKISSLQDKMRSKSEEFAATMKALQDEYGKQTSSLLEVESDPTDKEEEAKVGKLNYVGLKAVEDKLNDFTKKMDDEAAKLEKKKAARKEKMAKEHYSSSFAETAPKANNASNDLMAKIRSIEAGFKKDTAKLNADTEQEQAKFDGMRHRFAQEDHNQNYPSSMIETSDEYDMKLRDIQEDMQAKSDAVDSEMEGLSGNLGTSVDTIGLGFTSGQSQGDSDSFVPDTDPFAEAAAPIPVLNSDLSSSPLTSTGIATDNDAFDNTDLDTTSDTYGSSDIDESPFAATEMEADEERFGGEPTFDAPAFGQQGFSSYLEESSKVDNLRKH